MSARLIDDDEAIPLVAVRQHQPAFIERGPECLAAVRCFKAVEDRGGDRPVVDAETARLLLLLPACRPRPVVRLAEITHFLKAEFFFELPAKIFEMVLIQAGIDG